MGRHPRFSTDELLDAAGALLMDGGPSAMTASAVARSAGAPSGSVYHRFASRDELAASLWMRTVERFDAEVVALLQGDGPPVELAVSAALATVSWSSAHPADAFVLTMFRRSDLVGGDVSPELAERAQRLGERQRAAVDALARRLGRPTELVSFAVAGIPMAVIRRHIADCSVIPPWASAAVEEAVRAVLAIRTDAGEPS
jgi:AcrR family transcriptional regulator